MAESFVYEPGAEDFHPRALEIYRELRDEHPVYHDDERQSWALSRYDDVKDSASDAASFSSANTKMSVGLLPMLTQLDPPRHRELRSIMWKAFTPKRVADLEPRMRAIANELIDGFIERGSGDLMAEFAAQLPSRVIGELIGIPSDRRELFLEWTEAFIGADPERDWEKNPANEIYREFAMLLDERRAAPRDDLMSALIGAELDGETLSQEELLGFCFLLVIGGNDTTTNLIANGSVLLARHPEQRAQLCADPALIPVAIEEMLRYDAPTQALPRVALRDIELHGVTIPEGDEVSLVWAAANHDERRFEKPEVFDIHRVDNRHLALGHGVHFCMGAHLARLEGRVAFEQVLARLPDYALTEEPRWQRSPWARAYHSVDVAFSVNG